MTKTKTLRPDYVHIQKTYPLSPHCNLFYENTAGHEVKIVDYTKDGDNAQVWKYSNGRLIEHPNKSRELPSHLEQSVNKLPLHIKKVIRGTK